MTNSFSRTIAAFVALLALSGMIGLLAQTPPAGKTSPTTKSGQRTENKGERIFMTNCSRCHLPPTSIAPHITGTVIMHMRTRARLSREDEQLLLKYLAP